MNTQHMDLKAALAAVGSLVGQAMNILSSQGSMPRSRNWAQGVVDAHEGRIQPPSGADNLANYERGYDEQTQLQSIVDDIKKAVAA